MNSWYYINSQGQQVGPVDKAALMQAGLCSSSMVWCEGMSQWQPAGSVPELAELFTGNYGPAQPQTPPTPGAGACNTPPYGQQGYAPQQSSTPPPSYMWAAILTTLFCCLPFGIVAIVYAAKVDDAWFSGNQQRAYEYSRKAKNWSLWALLSCVIIFAVYMLLAVGLVAVGAL